MADSKKEYIYISLQEATKYCNYSQEYLSLRARQGKLKSVKFGRNWMTTREWLNDYVKKTEEYNNKINIKRLEEQKEEEKISLQPSFLKKAGKIPQNLPIKKIPTLRFGFAAALVIVLILATGVFGKKGYLNVFKNIPSLVQEFSQGFDRGLTKEIQSLAQKDIFEGVAEGIKTVSSGNYRLADIGEAFKDYGQWIGTNLKSNYSAANEKLENTVSSLGINLETIPDKVFQKY